MNDLNFDDYRNPSEQLLLSYILEWEEYIEMYKGQEWEFIARGMVRKLEKALEETEYYKRLCHAGVSTKHS
jgi:hypothetical protein